MGINLAKIWLWFIFVIVTKFCFGDLSFVNLNWDSIPFDSITDMQDVTTGIDEHLDCQLFIRYTYLMDTLLKNYIKSGETAGRNQALVWDK